MATAKPNAKTNKNHNNLFILVIFTVKVFSNAKLAIKVQHFNYFSELRSLI